MSDDICLMCKYNGNDYFCNHCQNNPAYDEYNKEFHDFDSLVNKNNIEIISEHILTEGDYQFILDKILLKGIQTSQSSSDDTCFKKLYDIASQYANIIDENDENCNGSYICNVIKLNQNKTTSKKISTLIHELSHHLVAEVLVESISYILKAKRNYIIESFVMFILHMHREQKIVDEFIAHYIENNYIPDNAHSYDSLFKVILEIPNSENNNLNQECIELIFRYGKRLALDIIDILDMLMGDELINSLKNDLKLDDHPHNDDIYSYFENIDAVTHYETRLSINDTLIQYIYEVLNNPELIDDLRIFYNLFIYYSQFD